MAGSVNIAMFITFRFISGAGAFMVLAGVPVSSLSSIVRTLVFNDLAN